MATFVVPFRPGGKTRLAHHAVLAEAMLADVVEACEAVGPVIVCDRPGGQGEALRATLAELDGAVAIVNADLPCASAADLERLVAAAPAVVAAADGTTNALGLSAPALFRPLYGPGSAERFLASAPSRLVEIPNLVEDVDTLADLHRLDGRLGPHTAAALDRLAAVT